MPSPLQAKRILVTRAKGQNDELIHRLQALGAVPVELPTIQIVLPADTTPLDTALNRLSAYHWLIFTSTNAVSFVWERLQTLGLPATPLKSRRVAAVGPATAARLVELDLPVHLVPERHEAEGLLEALPDVTGQRILLPLADIARDTLPAGLQARGALVDRVTAYCTQPAPPPDDLADRLAGVEVLLFTSSSTVRNLWPMVPAPIWEHLARSVTVACIGPKTAATARELGLPVQVVPQTYTIPDLLEALEAYLQSASPNGSSADQTVPEADQSNR